MSKTKSDNSERAVVVCTAKRGVFFGYTRETGQAIFERTTVTLQRARMCTYWSAETKGVLGLGSIGPQKGSRIGPQVPELTATREDRRARRHAGRAHASIASAAWPARVRHAAAAGGGGGGVMRTRWEVADEIERIEALPLDRAEKDRQQKTLLETLRIMRDIERIRSGR